MRRFRWITLVAVLAIVGATVSAGVAGAADTKEALQASDVGVTPTEVHVAVIADTGSSLAPGLFQGSVNGVLGWAKYQNSVGGIAGRKVVVDVFDSALDASKARNAIIDACAKDLALVGTSALFVSNVDDMVNCKDSKGAATGLPDFPVLQTETAHQCSPVSFGINPAILQCATKDQTPQTYKGTLGATNYYLKKFGKNSLHGLFVYPSDLKAAKNSQIPAFTAQQQAGIEQDATFDVSGRATQSAYTPFVQALKDNQSTYARHGGAAAGVIALMKEAKLQGVNTVKVWDCSLQCYDKSILAAPETEGLYVWTAFLPFDETKSNEMLKNFVKYVGADKTDGFSLQAFASGLLFAEASRQVVEEGGDNALTRAALLQVLPTITKFDGDGMLAVMNPGDRIVSRCYVLSQVKGGKFVRVFPKKAGTFDCAETNAYTVKLDLLNG